MNSEINGKEHISNNSMIESDNKKRKFMANPQNFKKKDINYNKMNVTELRKLCKERNLPNSDLKKKRDIIKLLEEDESNLVSEEDDNETENYEDMNELEKFLCEEVLPNIRKTGKYKYIFENIIPFSQLLNSNDFDKEANEIETQYDWSKNSNCPIVYLVYIGTVDNNGLIKVGFSHYRFDERLLKQILCESEYEKFRILDTYEVSGEPIGDKLHNLLHPYRYPFKNQKEIYKTTSNLKNFMNIVEKFLDDNDYKLKYNRILKETLEKDKEILKLKIKITNLEKENLELKTCK